MSESDSTTILALGSRDGSVVLSFPRPVREVTLDPQTAARVAEQMGATSRPVFARNTRWEGETQRAVIKARATLIIRSLLEAGKSPEYIASHVIDGVLREF